MAFEKQHLKEIEATILAFLEEIRPPEEIRNELDFSYKIEGQSVYINEIRPRWDKPELIVTLAVAKATYVKSKDLWKIYWQRGNLNWDLYEPHATTKSLDEFIAVVRADQYGCFFG